MVLYFANEFNHYSYRDNCFVLRLTLTDSTAKASARWITFIRLVD
jgi:hypothetical protein